MCSNFVERCEDLKKCMALTCFGKFLHTVIAGWDDCECIRAYNAICDHTSLLKSVRMMVGSKPGK